MKTKKKKKKSRNLLIISKTCFFHPGRMNSRWAAAFLERRLLWCQFSKFLSGLIVPINFLISSFLLVMSLSDCWQRNASFLLRTNSWSNCQTISQSHTPSPPTILLHFLNFLNLSGGERKTQIGGRYLLLVLCPLQRLLSPPCHLLGAFLPLQLKRSCMLQLAKPWPG